MNADDPARAPAALERGARAPAAPPISPPPSGRQLLPGGLAAAAVQLPCGVSGALDRDAGEGKAGGGRPHRRLGGWLLCHPPQEGGVVSCRALHPRFSVDGQARAACK